MSLAMSMTVGFVVFLLAYRRRDASTPIVPAIQGLGVPALPPAGFTFPTPSPLYMFGPSSVPQGPTQMAGAARPANYQTTMRTVAAGPGDPICAFEAVGDRTWQLQLRNVGPAGSFALVSTDPGSIRGTGAVPSGDGVTIPTGAFTDLLLYPRQRVYVRGSVANTMLTITGAVIDGGR